MNLRAKILDLERLPEWRAALKTRGQKLVVTNGCFDLLHLGHVTYLEAARNLGDALLVGVNGDASLRALKGEGRPVNPEQDRAAVVAALTAVDAVCVFPEVNALQFLSQALPDIYAKGGDYTIETINQEERRLVENLGGRVVVVSGVPGKSTSGLLGQLSEAETVREKVREGYGQIAQQGSERRGSGKSCCGCAPPDAAILAQHIGYSAEELAALPEGANMGLSCGNPTALAALQPGEVVLDLGAGGGFDLFLAGRRVGVEGRAIGVDMTPEMLSKARKNTEAYRQTSGLSNVEFRLGEIEHLPVADSSVDVVISNCVINLSPDKPQVWREIARVLKPGGRVAVSDLALLRPLPPAVLEMVEALVGCVAGAVLVLATEQMAKAAGLVEVKLTPKSGYVDGLVDWRDPLYEKILEHLPPGAKPSEYITSLEVSARKAASICQSGGAGSARPAASCCG